jgi:hypothetical protein
MNGPKAEVQYRTGRTAGLYPEATGLTAESELRP